jgi:hypothetical protein
VGHLALASPSASEADHEHLLSAKTSERERIGPASTSPRVAPAAAHGACESAPTSSEASTPTPDPRFGTVVEPKDAIRAALAALPQNPDVDRAYSACLAAVAVRMSSQNQYRVAQPDERIQGITGCDGVLTKVMRGEARHFYYRFDDFPAFRGLRDLLQAAPKDDNGRPREPLRIEVGSALWYELIVFLEETLHYPDV